MYDPCENCGAEDCQCCEVWLERQADARYYDDGGDLYDLRDSMYDYGCDYYGNDDRDDDYEFEENPYEDFGDWGYESMREE